CSSHGRALYMLKRFRHNIRTQVRATDTDVHNIRDGFTCVAFPTAGYYLSGEFFHVVKNPVHFGHDIGAVDNYRFIAAVAQGDVQHGPSFRAVDLLTAEHRAYRRLQFYFVRQPGEEFHSLLYNEILGIVDQDIFKLKMKLFKAVWIILKEVAHLKRLKVEKVGLQVAPHRQVGGVVILQHLIKG